MNDQSQKSEIAKKEEEILEFWKKNNIFHKTLEKNDNKTESGFLKRIFGKNKKEFIFYEGPPTANGKPGIHHLEARAFKDIIPRYKTMRGFHVRRKGGWDTHGLPVELQVEKELGFKSKKEIEEYGIEKFNQKCKESVWRYVDEWREFTERIAFWVDLDNAYVTYDPKFMESVWHILSKVNDKGLLYKDYKVLPWCPRCQTALSSHELAQGYEQVKDLSLTVKLKVKNPEDYNLPKESYFLAWTTTPWTLPGNVGLAVGKDVDYAVVEHEDNTYVLAKELVKKHFENADVKQTLKGKDLVGISYEPLFGFLPEEKRENAFKVYPASFVTTTEGTGIVHTAVMYGQDDFILGTEVGLPKHHLVNVDGTFVDGTGFLAKKFVKDEETEVSILKDLAKRGLLFSKEKYEHSYPFCWRCKTPIIYYARDSWYIRMSELRDDLISENKKINWEPSHTRDGRFGEWISEVKDWAISRERYWGTPLPVWETKDGKERLVVDSVKTLADNTKLSGNKYFVMRHGLSDNNVTDIISSDPANVHHITEDGRNQTVSASENLKGEKIDMIFSSVFLRTRETAEIVAEAVGMDKNDIVIDSRLQEIGMGVYEGKTWEKYYADDPKHGSDPGHAPNGGESRMGVRKRVGEFLYELENKYKDKNILIVSHGLPLKMLQVIADGSSINEEGNNEHENFRGEQHASHIMRNAEVAELTFIPLPHNENFELDLHKPYIDDVVLVSSSGADMMRTNEVIDVWFDAGSMPFGQDHYPFENKDWVDNVGYPADYISEAIDQTRGWFYTLHAIGILLGRGRAYKNVISLGHVLDNKGKKMSKSIGNVIDPQKMIDKYGVDALRFFMYTVNQPGDSKNFDERVVDEIIKKVFNLLLNSVKFFKLYEDDFSNTDPYSSKNVLDIWILARLDKLSSSMTKNLDNYKIFEAAREIRTFIADLSQWYIRRSRDRFKESGKDKKFALVTTKYVLLTLSKLIAPFMPFLAEDVYTQVGGGMESVHLEGWPVVGKLNKSILTNMKEVRSIVSLGLEARSSVGIKIRQPLSKLMVKNNESRIINDEGMVQLIKDEINVKNVEFGVEIETEVELDTKLTPELEEEGRVRELVRSIQVLRKNEKLKPSDTPKLLIDSDEKGRALVERNIEEIKSLASLSGIEFSNLDTDALDINGLSFKISL